MEAAQFLPVAIERERGFGVVHREARLDDGGGAQVSVRRAGKRRQGLL